MKKHLPLIFLFSFIQICLLSSLVRGQNASGIPYSFSITNTGTVNPFTGPAYNLIGLSPSTIILDEFVTLISPVGMNVPFAGVNYQKFVVSTNGWIALVPASVILTTTLAYTSAAGATSVGLNVTVGSTAGLVQGMLVTVSSGTGAFPANTYVTGITSATVFTVGNVASIVLSGGAVISAYTETLPAPFTNAYPTNNLVSWASSMGYPIIAPYWDDNSSTSIRWNWSGITNVLWVVWNSRLDKGNATNAQIIGVKIDAASGVISLVYSMTNYTPTVGFGGASIGIAGICAGDYYSVTPTSTTVATVDSSAENTAVNIKPGSSTNSAFYNFTPVNWFDNCSSALNAGTITASCTNTTLTTLNALTSGSTICGTSDVKDVWVKYTKPAGVDAIKFTTSPASCGSVAGTTIEVFSTCGGTSLGCAQGGTTYPAFGELTIARPCTSEVLYVRISSDGDVAGKFQICAVSAPTFVSPTTGTTCSNPTFICSLPYSQSGLSTVGSGNEYDSLNSACHDPYMNGEDFVFSYTPTSTICVSITVTSTGSNPSIFVTDGCPNLGTTNCISSAYPQGGTLFINSITLNAGQTYYFIVDNNPIGGSNNVPFSINVTQAGTTPVNSPCASATNLGTILNNVSCAFSASPYTTECAAPSPASGYPVPSCANFSNGVTGDVWFRFTAGFTGNLLIRTQAASTNAITDAGMAVYTGSCGSFFLFACDNNSAGNNMPLLSLPVSNGVTYYIRVWTVSPGVNGMFDLCISSACAPPNDLPCSAIFISTGGTATGFNTCAGSNNEPPNSAQCTPGGIINTVWYKTVVPASGQLKIRTNPLTLTDTQIQAFTFPTGCSNSVTSYVSKGCNDDGPDCGVQNNQSYHDYSELILTGQIPGDTIYIAVDGFGSSTGTFEITTIDGTGSYAPVYLQDCDVPYDVCGAASIVQPDPGALNFGNICDFSTNYDCWNNPERNSHWYRVTVNPGTFQFAVNSPSDYDFIMWDITGLSNVCASIQAHTITSVRCNWVTTTGQTGISVANSTGGWGPAITISGSPRTYLLLVNNWNPPFQINGYTLDWMGSPIASSPSSVSWNGSVDTMYTSVNNWGTAPCNSLPSCNVDATISTSASGRMPTLTVNTQVKNMVINSGATLRIKTGITLDICGNMTNNGSLIAEAGSTIRFIGTGTQTVTGNFTGTNAFANLTITKSTGIVTLNSNIDVNGNFTTTNATSIFNVNVKYMRVAGDFLNNTANTTFTGVVGSMLEFYGAKNQNFVNQNGSIALSRVRMNKTAGKVYLSGANSIMNIDSTLTLTSGIIVTRSLAALEVYVRTNLSTSISGHNTTSFIDGKLRRKVYNSAPLTLPFSLDFPVGDSLSPGGYELANITFNSGTVVPDLLAWFMPWPSGAPNPGPTANECVIATYDALPVFNHGFWTFQKASAFFNGNYKITLYNSGFTNNSGSGWTVARADINANPSLTASWSLTGTCVTTSTAISTIRDLINTPASSATSFNHLYTTVQSQVPLPVELLYFNAEPFGKDIICKWETATEINNERFEVERSDEGEAFAKVASVNGFGAGTTTQPHQYKITDLQACSQLRYYRLKQIDIDGRATYSPVVSVRCGFKNNSINVFPNPATSSIVCTFETISNTQVKIDFVDVFGNNVKEEKHSAIKGLNSITSDLSDLPSGVYYLRLFDPGSPEPIRMARFVKN